MTEKKILCGTGKCWLLTQKIINFQIGSCNIFFFHCMSYCGAHIQRKFYNEIGEKFIGLQFQFFFSITISEMRQNRSLKVLKVQTLR